MQLGDLVSVYGGGVSGNDRGRGRGGYNRGRGGRGQHHRGSHSGAPAWTPMPPPAPSQQPFMFGAVHQLPPALAPPPMIVHPGMASQFYQGPPKLAKEKGKFGCETCDKFFATEALLQGHNDEHEQCTHQGCAFSALPKVVAAHTVIHTRAIPSLNTPEEIARYRMERRKNFPTDVNVKKRQEEEEEKRKRGEIPLVVNKRGRRGRGGQQQWMPQHLTTPISAPAIATAAVQPLDMPAPPALAALAAYADSDDAPTEVSAKTALPLPQVLLEEGELKPRATSNEKKRRCTYFLRGNCKKGDTCPFSHEPLPPRHRSSTLLQRVYEKDIRREYSAALQCLRYIVQNNFLQ